MLSVFDELAIGAFGDRAWPVASLMCGYVPTRRGALCYKSRADRITCRVRHCSMAFQAASRHRVMVHNPR
jgi:hypothetical protein